MTRPRKALVSPEDTPYYHCVSRCVRRAFLCGFDPLTSRSFEHRRGWIVERIHALAAIFAIDIAAYAVMSNHYHVVLRLDIARASAWSDAEVCKHWGALFGGPAWLHRFVTGEVLSDAELSQLAQRCTVYRERLASLSWFMRCLNEPIARWANAEDGCTGRFWEGRFHSQALLDGTALLTCMAYVDLNPIRAGLASTPEDSDFTSIQERIAAVATRDQGNAPGCDQVPAEIVRPDRGVTLLAFAGSTAAGATAPTIPFAFPDYLELVDWTGRVVRAGKHGAIPADLPPIFTRLNLPPESWLDSAQHFRRRFNLAVGPIAKLEHYCRHLGQRWLRGQRTCALLYPDPLPA